MPRFLRFLTVLLSLVFLSISPVRAAIVPGPELAPVRTVLGPPAFDQFSPRIASGGNGFLAVWTETASAGMAIHATRLSAEGTPVDVSPLVIGAGVHADVTWDGRRYLVVWSDLAGVFARFVGTDRAMSEPVRLSQPAPYSIDYAFPRVTFNGRLFFAAWTEFARPARFAGALVDASGAVTKPLELGDAE